MLFSFLKRPRPRIYLDYAAATPLRKEVVRVMEPFYTRHFANPSAIHQEGLFARRAIDAARLTLARVLGVREQGVVFTGNGTESNNLAILGTVKARHAEGVSYSDMEVITTSLEHPSVGNLIPELELLGVTVRIVDVDEEGFIILDSLQECLSTRTVLLSYAYANSEIGVVQRTGKIARLVRKFSQEHDHKIAIHLDAAQAPLWLPCDLPRLDADLLSLDAGKCEGPKGVGVLAMRYGTQLQSILAGGGQEFGLRPGTENVAGIVGASEACVRAQLSYSERSERAVLSSQKLLFALTAALPRCVLNGPPIGKERLSNNVHISIPGIDSEYAVVVLDASGIAASTKSACGGVHGSGSHVVRSISKDEERAISTFRFTHSGVVEQDEISRVVDVLVTHTEMMDKV